MRRFSICAAIVLLVLAVESASRAPAYEWQAYGGHLYTVTDQLGTWQECEAEAVAAGGHLVTINDTAENVWLSEVWLGDDIPNYVDEYWTGFTDSAQEGHWVWVSGEGGWWEEGNLGSTSFTSWGPSQPDNYPHVPEGQDYGSLNTIGSSWDAGTWDDLQGSYDNYIRGIIEVVPEPSTFALLGMGVLVLFACARRKRS